MNQPESNASKQDENSLSSDTFRTTTPGENPEPDEADLGHRPSNKASHDWTTKPLPEDEDFDEDDAHLSLVLNEWASGTSIHGVGDVADFITWQRWKRIMWMILVCLSGALMLWQITQLIKEYRKHDVSTSIDTIVTPSLVFPEITVCNYEARSRARMNSTGIQNPKNSTELAMISQPLEEFIIQTSFNGKDLDSSSVWKKVLVRDKYCFSFHTDEKVGKASLGSGLVVSLYLNQSDYPPKGVSFAAAEIWAELPGSHINDQIPYVTAIPGQATVANMRMTRVKRVTREPWANCIGSAPNYTQATCRTQCENELLQRMCGCKKDFSEPSEPNLCYCSTDQDKNCTDHFYETTGATLSCPHCVQPPCEDTKFEVITNAMDFAESFLQFLQDDCDFINATKEVWDQNLAFVAVNFDEIEYTELYQSEAVTLATLLGSIGGSMGLFLGISIVSVFEVFGDLGALRVFPRFFGYRNLRGVGARTSH